MAVRPISPQRLVSMLAQRVSELPLEHPRVALDGAPAAQPEALADALVDPLRVLGRPVVRVRAGDFLRPASLRFERGRHDPDARYDDWLDAGALRRELLDPLGPGGSGEYLPRFWDPVADRAARAGYVQVAARAAMLVDGALLLGRGLPFDLTVHLGLGAGALHRRTPEEDRWMLPAFARYAGEVDPERAADVAVRVDDPRHPALVELTARRWPR